MADEKKDQILYRPDLEPERHYLSDDVFQRTKVPNVPIPDENTPDIEEPEEEEEEHEKGLKNNPIKETSEEEEKNTGRSRTGTPTTTTTTVPEQLKQQYDEIKNLIPLLPSELQFLVPTIERIITRIDVQWPNGTYEEETPKEYIPGGEIPDEIDYIDHVPQKNNPYLTKLPDLFPKPANVVIALETPKTLVDIVKETYAKDQVELETYYLQQLQIIMQKYFQQMLTIVADAGAMYIEDLTENFEGDEVKVPEGQGLEHLRDYIVRSQISRDQMSRLFKKTHSVDRTMMHLRSWHAAELQRERYYGEKYKDSTSYCDSHSNSLLRESRSSYNAAYSSAFYDMFKYLNSSTILTSDILNATVKEAQAKAELMKNGVDIYARNLQDQEIEKAMNDAGQIGDGSGSAEVINGADAYNTQTTSSDSGKTTDASGSTADSSSDSGKSEKFKDGDSDIEAANGTHFSKNDLDYLKGQGYSEQDAINELNKVDKYSKKVDKNDDGTYSYAKDTSKSDDSSKKSGNLLDKISGAIGGGSGKDLAQQALDTVSHGIGGGFGGGITGDSGKDIGDALLKMGTDQLSKHLGGGIVGNIGRAALNAATGQTGNHEGGSFLENVVSGIQIGGASVGDIVSGVKNISKGNMSDEDYVNLATDVITGVFDKKKRGAILQDITKQASSGSPFTGNSKYTAPNGLKIKQNDIDYLIKQGYSESDAVAYLGTCDKYSAKSEYKATAKRKKGDSDYVSPNGKYIKQNDIDYLIKQGYSTKDAVDFLNTQDTYKTPQVKNHSSKYSHYKAPNGRHIQWNDINYLIKQGYSEESAVEYLKTADKYKAEEPKRNSSKDNDKNKGKSSSSSSTQSSSSGSSSAKSSSTSSSSSTTNTPSSSEADNKPFKFKEVKENDYPAMTEDQRKVKQEAASQKSNDDEQYRNFVKEIDANCDQYENEVKNLRHYQLYLHAKELKRNYQNKIVAEAQKNVKDPRCKGMTWRPTMINLKEPNVSILEKYTSFRATQFRDYDETEKVYYQAYEQEREQAATKYMEREKGIASKYGNKFTYTRFMTVHY